MCKYGTRARVLLGKEIESIDSCIAPIIRALNKNSIKSWASCCGHQKNSGSHGRIDLKDGRILIIIDGKRYKENSEKYLLELALWGYWNKIKHNLKWKTKNLIYKLSPKRMRDKKNQEIKDAMNKRIEVKGMGWKAKPVWRHP